MNSSTGSTAQPAYLVSYPKSGSTWLRFLVANCVSDARCDFTNLHQLMPDTHLEPNTHDGTASSLLCKSHDAYRPDYGRVIYLVRDGRDVAVSYYFHWKKHHLEEKNISFEEFVARFNTGRLDAFGSWSNHVMSWLDKKTTDLVVVRYEDLRENPHTGLRKVMTFLGVQVADDVLQGAVENSSFQRMQQLEQAQHHLCPTLAGTDPSIPFVRSGQTSQFRDVFNNLLLKDFEACHGGALKRLGYKKARPDPEVCPVTLPSRDSENTSPVTGSRNVGKERVINVQFICRLYREHFGINVEPYFKGHTEIGIYRCLDTGYLYYYPLEFEGDSRFYQALETIPWYYMDWKPEHDIALPYVQSTDRVLEIGCARGAFLKRLQQSGIQCIGLELNRSAAARARQSGVVVLEESVQLHARHARTQYDFVCFFQVLEHVSQVQEFVQSSVDLLKPGGLLCIGVPNYQSFVGLDNANPLEMPPHHVGMWTESALVRLADVFELEVEHVECESLQPYHVDYFANVARTAVGDIAGLHEALHRLARDKAQHLKGHTVVALYRKRNL